jgi:hypothetical protein
MGWNSSGPPGQALKLAEILGRRLNAFDNTPEVVARAGVVVVFQAQTSRRAVVFDRPQRFEYEVA